MSNITSSLRSAWTQGKFNWLFQLMVIFTVGLTLAIVGCSEDKDDGDGDGDVMAGGVDVVQGVIIEDQTLTADNEYLLRGAVKVQDGVTLTIEPGVTIYGESSTNGTLIIAQGAKIVADGTADAPIIMTSDAEIGSRSRGQWGGLIINGRAPTNHEVDAYGEGNTGAFGGDNPNDNSGVLRYVRVEYAGIEFSPEVILSKT